MICVAPKLDCIMRSVILLIYRIKSVDEIRETTEKGKQKVPSKRVTFALPSDSGMEEDSTDSIQGKSSVPSTLKSPFEKRQEKVTQFAGLPVSSYHNALSLVSPKYPFGQQI